MNSCIIIIINNTSIIADSTMVKTNAESCREYRARKKAEMAEKKKLEQLNQVVDVNSISSNGNMILIQLNYTKINFLK